MLHILNGDSLAPGFEDSDLEGETLIWREILADGPVAFDNDRLFALREQYIHELADEPIERYRDQMQTTMQRLQKFDSDVTLWFEHDLVCQVNLLFLLHNLRPDKGGHKIYLVCINNHPAVENFKGLSQLNGAQLARLYNDRVELTELDLLLASEIWKKYCDADALQINNVVNTDFQNLKFLRQALIAHLQRFPDQASGLNSIERKIISYVNTGVSDPGKLVKLMLGVDRIYGYTDLIIAWYMQRLDSLFSNAQELSLTERAKKIFAGDERFDAPAMAIAGSSSKDFVWNETLKKLEPAA